MSHERPSVSEKELDDLGEYLFDEPLNGLMKRVTNSRKRQQNDMSDAPPNPFRKVKGGVEELLRQGMALREKDPIAAARMIRAAAEGGLPKAMNTTGELYSEGLGVVKDDHKAVQWWEKGVAAGSVDAMANLGMCYVEGRGVERDWPRGVQLFRVSAEGDGEHGWRGLGLCYQYGVGVEKDEKQAERLRAKAVEVGRLKKDASRHTLARQRPEKHLLSKRVDRSVVPGASASDALQETKSALARLRSRKYYIQRRPEAALTDIRPLEVLTRTSLEARLFVLEKSGYVKLISILSVFPEDRRLQELGIHILRNLARDVKFDDPKLLSYLLAKGPESTTLSPKHDTSTESSNGLTILSPIAFILSILKRHLSIQTIQAVGCSALAAFAVVSLAVKCYICDHGGVDQIVNAMNSHPSSALVQEMGSRGLCDLCGRPSTIQIKRLVANQGGIEPLVKSITHFSSDDSNRNAAVLEQACEALRNVCWMCEANSADALRFGAASRILSTIRLFIRHEAIVGWGLAALSALRGGGEVLWEENAVEIVRLVLRRWTHVQGVTVRILPVLALMASVGGDVQHQLGSEFLKTVMRIIRRFGEEQRAIEYGCECLSEMCLRDYANQVLAIENDAPRIVVDALVRYADQASVVETACAAIYAIADENAEGRKQIIESHGIEAVVNGLRRFEHSSANLVEASAAALRVLGEEADCQAEVNDLKGADLLVDAMKNYPKSSGVQEQCSGGIAVLGQNNEVLKARLAETGAVATLIQSIDNFTHNPFVLEQCCAAVQCLAAKNAGISIMFVTRGLTELLVKAVHRHMHNLPGNGPLLEAICDTFACLGSEHVSHKDIIGGEGGIEALVDVVHNSASRDVKSLTSALSALSTLSSDSEANRDRMNLCEGVTSIINVLRTRRDYPRVAELACSALCNACRRHDRNRDELSHSNGVEAILSAMKRYRKDEPLVEQACWVLAVACVNTPQLQRRLAKSKGITILVDSMKDFPRSAPLQAAACALIFSCAVGNEANQRRVVMQGGRSIIVKALQQHPESRKVNLYGTHALRVLEDTRMSEPDSGPPRAMARVQSYTGPLGESIEGDTEDVAQANSDDPGGRRSLIWRRRTKSSPVSPSKWNVVRKRLRAFTLVKNSKSRQTDTRGLTGRAIDDQNGEVADSESIGSEF
eukprot:Plantae.Rhodophyta-Hildenbrandia_rubra.ctg3262.p1 GENE.Plantae.Rhodophyta-Hildenbrandia_rubra.ctg3262~~Plantae.Rhodophyta-Hildenbrandia_rubra.ctg3262.p1  ORF type:complete len:1167 (+),score=165.59 Plantae.Rhodophyta-Hildenbrandia_rubra.ctg3262:11524-15024(+)